MVGKLNLDTDNITSFSPPIPQDVIEKTKESVIKKLKVSPSDRKNSFTIERISDALVNVISMAKPFYAFKILKVEELLPGGIVTSAGVVKSRMFSLLARKSKGEKYLVFLISSIGLSQEDLYKPDDPIFHQLIMDTAAGELVDYLTDYADELSWIKIAEENSLDYTLRFSPGYCDWELKGQQVIFKAFEGDSIEVKLTDSFVMLPDKSVSAVALIADEIPFPAPCPLCPIPDCPWRRMAYGGR